MPASCVKPAVPLWLLFAACTAASRPSGSELPEAGQGGSMAAGQTGPAGSGGQDGTGANPPAGGQGTAPETPTPGAIPTRMEPSFDPPGGLAVTDVPQFVVLGFDDNRYVDGMKWVLDVLEARKNPAGMGKARTHDGAPVRVAFYHTTDALERGGEALLAQWRRAVAAGHEVANHTHTHRALENEKPWSWSEEIEKSNAILIEKLGLAPGSIRGFRAPFLSFDVAMFETLKATAGMVYDCSLTHIPVGGMGEMWRFYRHLWPYTLHAGTDGVSGQWQVGEHPGIWEIPVYTMPTVGPARENAVVAPMAGFDSTAYGTLKRSAEDFANSMRWALDLRLEPGDNRAPLTIGLHSDTYSAEHQGYAAPLEARRQALLDFIDYALTKPEVRFVSAVQLLEWMGAPSRL